MSRIVLSLVFVLWMVWTPPTGGRLRVDWPGLILFLGGYLLLVLLLALWARVRARHVAVEEIEHSVSWFNRVMSAARLIIPLWFAYGVFYLSWGLLVNRAIDPHAGGLRLPAILVGTAPALFAWMGLWWAEYPIIRAIREKNVLAALDMDLPVHMMPRFRHYLAMNFRLQILFTLVPLLMILALRDLVAVGFWLSGRSSRMSLSTESAVVFASTAVVFILAPEILRRVLNTQPLPNSPLRQRLEALCRKYRLRYRQILLWRTQNNMGNAAVMGIVPQMRFILLSDLLLETMSDRQIEAVFAHEIGHVVHRHMTWYVILFVTFLMAIAVPGPGQLLSELTENLRISETMSEVAMTIGATAIFVLAFGYLSRRFERQADVFAARTLQSEFRATDQMLNFLDPASPAPAAATSHVGEYGATIFASALHRVALINNIPVTGRNWTHGSIAARMEHVRELSADPARTRRFDRGMTRVYLAVLLLLFTFGVWTAASWWNSARQSSTEVPRPVAPVSFIDV